MRVSFLLAMVGVGLLPSVASATNSANFGPKSTGDLNTICSTPDSNPLRSQAINFCEGYLLAVVSYDDAIADGKHLKRLICYPSTATRDQGIQGFISWATSHQQDQELMNAPPLLGAIRGLAATWPCNSEAKQ